MDWDALIRFLSLRDANTRVVMLGIVPLGLAAGVIGSFAVLRRRALLGDAVAHAALPGVCVAFLLAGGKHFATLLLGAIVFGVLSAGLVSLLRSWTRVKDDALLAMVIGGSFGLGAVMLKPIQRSAGGSAAGLEGFIFGKAASMVRADAITIGIACAVVLAIAILLYKELKLLCFDEEYGASQGWRVRTLDLILMLAICICVVAGLPAVGVVLMVALLVIPAVTARMWTDRLGIMLLLAGVLGVACSAVGVALSASLKGASMIAGGWPTGPLIVIVAAIAFVLSVFIAPRRGVLANALRRWRFRRKVTLQHLLRSLFEREELGEPGWPARAEASTIQRAMRLGLIEHGAGGELALTDSGRTEAARVVRAHRLWELFLIQQVDIAPDHVDRDADELEHVLSPELLARLEDRLRAEGRFPLADSPRAAAAIPISPHAIAPVAESVKA